MYTEFIREDGSRIIVDSSYVVVAAWDVKGNCIFDFRDKL